MNLPALSLCLGLLTTAAGPCLALVADGQPSFHAGNDTGVYVWRTWTGDWQVRVLAAAGAQHFVGRFDTADPVTDLRGLALESSDAISVDNQHTVNASIDTARYSVDGLVFTAGTGGACLRTSSSVPLFLGKHATRVTAPVDLTGSGACAGGADVPASDNTDAQPSALEVRRLSKLDWQVRLAPANEAAHFDGAFDLTEPPVSVQGVDLENTDRISQPNPTTLSVHLETWPGWSDEVDFTAVEFSKVCLRSTSGREQIVSLTSKGQQTPLHVTTPVDLTNNGACGVPTDPFPPPTYGRRFNPGHYVVLMARDGDTSIADAALPGVRGVLKRYSWRQLEPSPGRYDFSAIAADLANAAGHGLQLIAMIEDKSFSGHRPTPDYLSAWTLPNLAGGYSVVRWDPYVVGRYDALMAALGARFDADSHFEGIATSESAHGLGDAAMKATGYTPEKYRDVLIQELTSTARSFPRSRVFWFMNYLWGGNYYLGEIARQVAPLGVVMGGPDVAPDDQVLAAQAYPFYDGGVGRMPLFGQVEPQCYHHLHADTSYPTTYWTPSELFAYARDRLHVSYMFWERWPWNMKGAAYGWSDAVPVIEGNPVFNQ